MRRLLVLALFASACCTPAPAPSSPDAPLALDAPRMRDVGMCPDRDDDGLADYTEGEEDVDGDGLSNADDLDSDGDGLTDVEESDPSPLCRYAVACACGPPMAYAADTDGDGLADPDERARGTDVCLPDSDFDGCPDGATCGAALTWGQTSGYLTTVPVNVGYRLADDAAPQAVLRLDVELPVPSSVTIREVIAVRITGGGTAEGDHFVDVQPGAVVDFQIVLEQTRETYDPETLDGRTSLEGDEGALAERPLQIYVSCQPPLII